MKKFQIVEVAEGSNHAGAKAPADIAEISEKLGFSSVFVRQNTDADNLIGKVQRQVGFYFAWNNCMNEIEENSVVLIQNPFHNKHLTRNKVLRSLKEKKKVKFISVIHDVEELRKANYNDYYRDEFSFMLDLSDVFIVHNSVMMNFFVQKGFAEDRLVNLEIFDYLHPFQNKTITFSKSLSIAGNLDTAKCKYIGKLTEISGVSFKLYGPNFNETMKKYSHIEYCGSFPANEIPGRLNDGFGLVWDGTDVTGCQGDTGQYLKYNNPHKLSLYLSSGLPVVIWKEAAEAAFVKKHHVGICVGSLFELQDILKHLDEAAYFEMQKNVQQIAGKLTGGYYSTCAINEALRRLEL